MINDDFPFRYTNMVLAQVPLLLAVPNIGKTAVSGKAEFKSDSEQLSAGCKSGKSCHFAFYHRLVGIYGGGTGIDIGSSNELGPAMAMRESGIARVTVRARTPSWKASNSLTTMRLHYRLRTQALISLFFIDRWPVSWVPIPPL
jgi:hypothetical protein